MTDPVSNYFDTFVRALKVYAKHLEPMCKAYDLTRTEVDVLIFLCKHPEMNRAADIVEYRYIAKSHVSASVAGLEARGLLMRSAAETDRRANRLQLTAEGMKIAEEGVRRQADFIQKVYQGVDEEALARWAQAAHTIRENIENME